MKKPSIMFAVLVSLISCKTRTNNELATTKAQTIGTGCKMIVPASLSEMGKSINDAFVKRIINASSCSAQFKVGHQEGIADMLKGVCKTSQRAFVTEAGNFRKTSLDEVRKVDFYSGCGDGTAKDENIWATNSNEVISFDATTHAFNYYTSEQGIFTFHGNSYRMATDDASGVPTHPCTQCHINGSLVMKELKLPWVNWHSNLQNSSHVQSIKELQAEMIATDSKKMLLAAEVLENLILPAHTSTIAETIRRIKADELFFTPTTAATGHKQSLREVLKPLFCETELQTESKGIPAPFGGGPNAFDFVVSAHLVQDFSHRPNETPPKFSVKLSVQDWINASEAEGHIVPAGGAPEMFRMTIPVRSNFDNEFVKALVAEKMIEQKLVDAVRTVDFQNPIFSTRRCNLLTLVPAVEFLSAGDAKKITETVFNAVATKNTDPKFPGAANFGTLDYATEFTKFATACNTEGSALKNGNDLYRLVRSKRMHWFPQRGEKIEFPNGVTDQRFAVEGFVRNAMVPQAARIAKGDFDAERHLRLNEACKLEND